MGPLTSSTKIRLSIRTLNTFLNRRYYQRDYSELSKEIFWKSFYKKKKTTSTASFDWMITYEDVRHLIRNQNNNNCLDVGCGLSTFMEDLRKEHNPRSTIAIDNNMTALQMKNNNCGVDYIRADARCLPFPDSQFDLTVDKGTLDSFLKDRTAEGHETSKRVFLESLRVTRMDLIQLTDEDPDLRIELLNEFDPNININVRSINSGVHMEYFIYTINKIS